MTARRELTSIERVWQQNLKRIWLVRKVELGLTQESLAQLMGFKAQASVASFLNGRLPLHTDAKLKFAKALRVDVSEIDPDVSLRKERLPVDADEFLSQYSDGVENLPVSEQIKLASKLLLFASEAKES